MYIKDDGWLEDSLLPSKLPSNQLFLLRSMVGVRLINIQRSLSNTPHDSIFAGQEFFRKSNGAILFQMENLPPIYIDDYRYHKQERSIAVSLELPGFGGWQKSGGRGRRFTLYDHEYVDDRLCSLAGQSLIEMYLLIRKPELRGDRYRALQDSLQLTFENERTIVVSYFLGSLAGSLQIRYPEEIRWEAVRYKINISKGKIPLVYRFNRWKWRFLYYLGNEPYK